LTTWPLMMAWALIAFQSGKRGETATLRSQVVGDHLGDVRPRLTAVEGGNGDGQRLDVAAIDVHLDLRPGRLGREGRRERQGRHRQGQDLQSHEAAPNSVFKRRLPGR
jgi:hypothetical protein